MTLSERLQRIEDLMIELEPIYPQMTARELKYKAAEMLDQMGDPKE